jgi:hypothetical protein
VQQRCQIIFFKSARSDVKIRQNPPSRIGQIRQKSARNWEDFRPFFSLRVVFVAFLVRILPYLRSGQGEIFYFFLKIFWNFFFQHNFMLEKVRNKLFIANGDSKTARIHQICQTKQTHAKLVKSARNPPEIGSPPEIIFAR